MRCLYGARPVREILEHKPSQVGTLLVRVSRKGGLHRDLVELAEAAGIAVEYVARDRLDELCGGGNHQGVAVLAQPYGYTALSDLVAPEKGEERSRLLLVLDQVQDPQNLGNIIRSAAVFGADGVVLPQRRSATVTPAVTRASVGMTERIPIARAGNLSAAIAMLRAAGFWVYGTCVGTEKPVWAVDLSGRVAFVIGSEGRGLRPRVKSVCDLLVTIPMRDGSVSLNAACAAAVVLYEWCRQVGTVFST